MTANTTQKFRPKRKPKALESKTDQRTTPMDTIIAVGNEMRTMDDDI